MSVITPLPKAGQVVQVRQRQYLVEDVAPSDHSSTVVRLSCIDDDARGQELRCLWEHELDAKVLDGGDWDRLAERDFDEPRLFAAYYHSLRWHQVTATDPRLFQAPFRAGIRLEAYQLEPLRKALLLPRVNLFIADDVGLGKTIEAGLIARELLLRKKVRQIVVACPPSVVPQWHQELESRFGLTFAILDRAYIAKARRERGYGVNPWTTHSRFLVSQRLLIDEDYAAGLRDWLGDFLAGSLLILDEAHHAAPAGGQKYAIDSKITKAILEASRKYQSDVSTRLSGQVVEAMYELLRGLQAANDRRSGKLLAEVLDSDPDQVYAGLLNVLLRLVFLLYAEDRGMMPTSGLYGHNYSVVGLFEQLREDVGRYTDTMEQRHGAWARLVVLFRLVHAGSDHPELKMPPRHGDLFNPDRFPFLEGRAPGEARHPGQALDVPLIPDGTVWRVLEKLLLLDGERLSYRALDVEQIGSVYESMMGFRLERATGRSIAVRAAKVHGAPATIDLEALLREPATKRSEWLKERTDQALTGNALTVLKAAQTPEDVVAALGKKVADKVTPRIVPQKAMVLQPSDARRRSGSHRQPT